MDKGKTEKETRPNQPAREPSPPPSTAPSPAPPTVYSSDPASLHERFLDDRWIRVTLGITG